MLDATNSEISLASELISQSHNLYFQNKYDDSLRILKDLIDRYWQRPGPKSFSIGARAYIIYLRFLQSNLNKREDLGLIFEQYKKVEEEFCDRKRYDLAAQLLDQKMKLNYIKYYNNEDLYIDSTRIIIFIDLWSAPRLTGQEAV
jgi:hypothetical protein